MKFIKAIFLAALLLSGTAQAADYFFRDCQTGAAVGCTPGNNSNAGTSASAPKQNLTGFNYNSMPAGTRLFFARGGAWSGLSTQFIDNNNVTPTSPLVFDAYTDSTMSSATALPIIRFNPGSDGFSFGGYNNTTLDGGYEFRNLSIRNDGSSDVNNGFFSGGIVQRIVVENCEITGWGLAMYMSSHHQLKFLVVRNSNIHHNVAMGFLGGADDIVIEGNTISYNNFSGSGFDHGIYLGGEGTNGIVRNNVMVNNSICTVSPCGDLQPVDANCRGGNLTVHGKWDGLVIEGNLIVQTQSADACYGIVVNDGYPYIEDEEFLRVQIRSNTVVNLGLIGILVRSVPGIIVENNKVINFQNRSQFGIVLQHTSDHADGNAVIRNNSIYFTYAKLNAEGIGVRADTGTGIKVDNNLLYYGPGSEAGAKCFEHTALSNFASFTNNLCRNAAGNGVWSGTYATAAAALSAGFNTGGLTSDPLFVETPSSSNNYSLQIQTSSPAKNAGNNAQCARLDFTGRRRTDGQCDIGAYEFR